MGEVRVEVRLTNLFEKEQARRSEASQDNVSTALVTAVVDTGAVMSVLPQRVVDQLDLPISRTTQVHLADGKPQQVGVVYGVVFEVLGRETSEEAYVLGNEVLIGQTVLEKLDLLVDCTNQTLIGRHPNGPLHRV